MVKVKKLHLFLIKKLGLPIVKKLVGLVQKAAAEDKEDNWLDVVASALETVVEFLEDEEVFVVE